MDSHFILSIFHVLIVVPLFLFIGFYRASTPQWLYNAIFVIGTIVLVYHGFKFTVRYLSESGYVWVNAIHILLVAPLLLYIGYHKRDTPRFAYELLLMLGFGAGGYHLFSAIKLLDMHHEPLTNED